jgi:beta-lactamase regulating signal transducer with metallopeptidase domain
MSVIDLAIRASVVLLAALIATRLLNRAAASTRHLVWTLAVAGVLILPVARAAIPEWRVLPTPDRSGEAPRHTSEARLDTAAPREGVDSRRWSTVLRAAAAEPGEAAQPFQAAGMVGRFGAAAASAWAAVALLLLVRIAHGVHAIRRLVRTARCADARWRALLERILEETGSGARVRLLVSGDIAMPMTWRRLVILPAAAAAWSDERARVVLLHELAHVRRGDWITHALARVTAALHWVNPLAWIALRAMTRERERACDDFVLAHGAPAADYAQHLLDIARAGMPRVAFAVAPAMARRSELEGRLLSILTPRPRHAHRGARTSLVIATVAATGLVAAAAPVAAPEASTPPRSAVDERRAIRGFTDAILGDHASTGQRPAAPDIDAFARALDDPSESVRESAALGLALRSGDDVVDPLLRAITDPSSQVREKAAMGLAMRPERRVVDALLDAMHDPDAQVREKVVIALGLSGDPRAPEALTAAMADSDEQVREKAVKALATLPLSDAIRDGIAGALKTFGRQ